jgi:hypothetical protein
VTTDPRALPWAVIRERLSALTFNPSYLRFTHISLIQLAFSSAPIPNLCNLGTTQVLLCCKSNLLVCRRNPDLTVGASAPESASSQRGASSLQANALRPVTECNCDAAMRGGEQQEVNDQTVG